MHPRRRIVLASTAFAGVVATVVGIAATARAGSQARAPLEHRDVAGTEADAAARNSGYGAELAGLLAELNDAGPDDFRDGAAAEKRAEIDALLVTWRNALEAEGRDR
jgi:hypothetical protein